MNLSELINFYLEASHPEVFCKKGVLRNFAKFTAGNTYARVSSLIKFQALGASVFLWVLQNF